MTKISQSKIAALYIPIFTWALFLSMLGQLVPSLRREFEFSMVQAGSFINIHPIGSVVAVLFCILFLDTFNKIKSLGLATLIFGILVAIVGFSPLLFFTLSMFFLIGLSSGVTNTLSNALISDLFHEKMASYLNLTHAFFSLGGVLGSLGANLFLSAFGGRRAFTVLGAIIFAFALYFIFVFKREMNMPLISEHIPIKQRLIELSEVIHRKGIKEVVIVSILFASFQVNMLFWGASYYIERSGNPMLGALALALFFTGTGFSRFVVSKYSNKYKPYTFISICSVLTAVAMLFLVLISNPVISLIFYGVIGFAVGNIWPQLITQSCTLAPDKSSVATGLVLLGYTLTAFVAPAIMGFIGDTLGLKYGFLLMAVMIFLAGIVSRSFKKYTV